MKKKLNRQVLSLQFYRVVRLIPDMLRHDVAFACDKFPGIVAYPTFRRGEDMWGGVPTVDRWRSFGNAGFDPTKLTDTEIIKAGINISIRTMCEHGWYTVEHDKRISLYDYLNNVSS